MQSSSLLHSPSFHPILKTSISAPGHENCTLNLHYELPPMIFVDPYELSNRADAYSFKYAGPSNLELPVFALSGDGDEKNAVLLLTISHPLSADVRANLRPVRSNLHKYPGPMHFLPALRLHPPGLHRNFCPQCGPNLRLPSTRRSSFDYRRRLARCWWRLFARQ
ncbi:hypothetical protein B0H12DRAFT_1113255 [Mycena haematopus]|nr:hypothetical protein B0H12DRAFT_1113255 [Mycena haematopus]